MNTKKDSKTLDPKYLARVERWKASQSRIRSWMRTKPDIDPEIFSDLVRVIGLPGTTTRPSGIKGDVTEALLEKGKLTELEIFKNWKIGQDSMRAIIRSMIKDPAPKDRVWIELDPKKEEYRIIGRGESPPEGWTGYLPPEEKEL